MRAEVMREFGVRLQARIKRGGFSNISELLRRLGIGHGMVTKLLRRDVSDVGLGKIAEIALILGMKPSELVAELDDVLLSPPPVTAAQAEALGLADWPAAFEPARLALVLDVVDGWLEETGTVQSPAEIGAMVADLYDEAVRPDPAVPLVRLRRRVTARMLGIELPDERPVARGRGRPSTAGAAA